MRTIVYILNMMSTSEFSEVFRITPLTNNEYLICFSRSCRSKLFSKVAVLKIFTKFMEKYLCWSLLFNKVAVCKTPILLKGDFSTGSGLPLEIFCVENNTYIRL